MGSDYFCYLKLIEYINANDGTDLIVKATIVHLWFVIIHPFEDGNGRIARALTDMLLARSENSSSRFYSMSNSEELLKGVWKKTAFWNANKNTILNERQLKILNILFENFEGNLTTSKWAKICNCSQDTATRDIYDLVEKNILIKQGAGRGTHYSLTKTYSTI